MQPNNHFISQKGKEPIKIDRFNNRRGSADYDQEQPAFLRVLEN